MRPKKEAPPTLKVEGFFSTTLAMILEAGIQKKKIARAIENMPVNGISTDPKRMNKRAVAKTYALALKNP
jgi:hypothetical protein